MAVGLLAMVVVMVLPYIFPRAPEVQAPASVAAPTGAVRTLKVQQTAQGWQDRFWPPESDKPEDSGVPTE